MSNLVNAIVTAVVAPIREAQAEALEEIKTATEAATFNITAIQAKAGPAGPAGPVGPAGQDGDAPSIEELRALVEEVLEELLDSVLAETQDTVDSPWST